MGTTRSDTRQRIQDVALDLFAEKGYDKTSLREIAEHLDVTKAALYYHFKTKEDILRSVVDDQLTQVEELIAWGGSQPRTPATKREVLSRYSLLLRGRDKLFRFMHENQASIRDLKLGEAFKEYMGDLTDLLRDRDADLTVQMRGITAVFALHAGMFTLADAEGTPEEKRLAALAVAHELVSGDGRGLSEG